jgi:hypothetical protein
MSMIYVVWTKDRPDANDSTYVVIARSGGEAQSLAQDHAYEHLTQLGRKAMVDAGLVRWQMIGMADVGLVDHIVSWQPPGWAGQHRRHLDAAIKAHNAEDAARSQLAARDDARERATHDRPGSRTASQ